VALSQVLSVADVLVSTTLTRRVPAPSWPDNSPLPSNSDPSLSGSGEGPADFANRWAPSPHTKTAINGVTPLDSNRDSRCPPVCCTHRAGEVLNGVAPSDLLSLSAGVRTHRRLEVLDGVAPWDLVRAALAPSFAARRSFADAWSAAPPSRASVERSLLLVPTISLRIIRGLEDGRRSAPS